MPKDANPAIHTSADRSSVVENDPAMTTGTSDSAELAARQKAIAAGKEAIQNQLIHLFETAYVPARMERILKAISKQIHKVNDYLVNYPSNQEQEAELLLYYYYTRAACQFMHISYGFNIKNVHEADIIDNLKSAEELGLSHQEIESFEQTLDNYTEINNNFQKSDLYKIYNIIDNKITQRRVSNPTSGIKKIDKPAYPRTILQEQLGRNIGAKITPLIIERGLRLQDIKELVAGFVGVGLNNLENISLYPESAKKTL